MKSVIKHKKQEKAKSKYPCLKISTYNGIIILFTAPQTGMKMNYLCTSNAQSRVGEYSATWDEDNFVLFDGEVTLSN